MIKIKTKPNVAEHSQNRRTFKYFFISDQWNIDLMVPEKILTVHADVPAEKVLDAVRAAGFKAELL